MHQILPFPSQEIIQRIPVCIGSSAIYLACSNSVQKHLHHIIDRHFHSFEHGTMRSVINPVFIMMLIAPFMMQPGRRIPLFLPLCIIRTSGSLVISTPHTKLCPSVFLQIMEQPLSVQTYLKACLHHKELMFCDRTKMSECVHL